jgi:hypothetical protein
MFFGNVFVLNLKNVFIFKVNNLISNKKLKLL